ncbi:MAG TPA: endopeptidase La [Firmicutes bacterium]|nr:endopeptidase La [Bacillota bacterium]
MEIKKRTARAAVMPLLALRGLVIFPEMILHFDVGRKKSIQALNEAMAGDQQIFLVTQKDIRDDEPEIEALYPVGVVARVRQVLRLSGDNVRVLVEGLYRARLDSLTQTEPFYSACIRECLERRTTGSLRVQALLRECRLVFEQYAALVQKIPPDVLMGVASAENVGYLADYIASNIQLTTEEKQQILETVNPESRMENLMLILARECSILSLEQDIQEKVRQQIDRNQKEYYLREQLKAITQELGEGDNPQDEAEEYRTKVKSLNLTGEAEEKLLSECEKLSKMPPGSHEATVVRGYLDTCLAMPWNTYTKDNLDLQAAARVLDRDHYGMQKVKERILETLAVRKMAPDIRGQVLCLAGPPGVGKTSVARSIAAAMGRKYVRVSLGGVRDEADIRGHRKTYIGAMPGRIMNAIRQAGTANPLVLLDEIDKMGNDFRGDPSSAMLEVLDVEQNAGFRDHYLEIPFDLSHVLFITTANDVSAIPAPLYDRMEVISLPSYTAEEKFHIAREHLLKKQAKRHGLNLRQLRMTDEALRAVIRGYTREAGVRGLERCLAQLCRKSARRLAEDGVKSVRVGEENLEEFLGPRRYKDDSLDRKDEVGVVNGLAWTAVGGETMPVEVAVLDGSGKIELTGSLGDVMKESARTAISYVRSRAEALQIDRNFYKNKDIHIHVPEGAVPKDGPSAGVTIATAMVSALTGIPVRHEVAMTGEITLRGRVLPIGGLREKSMAAYVHGMKTVIIPQDNEPDLAEVDEAVRRGVSFVPADHLDTVLRHALVRSPGEPAATKGKEPAAESAPHFIPPAMPDEGTPAPELCRDGFRPPAVQ